MNCSDWSLLNPCIGGSCDRPMYRNLRSVEPQPWSSSTPYFPIVVRKNWEVTKTWHKEVQTPGFQPMSLPLHPIYLRLWTSTVHVSLYVPHFPHLFIEYFLQLPPFTLLSLNDFPIMVHDALYAWHPSHCHSGQFSLWPGLVLTQISQAHLQCLLCQQLGRISGTSLSRQI